MKVKLLVIAVLALLLCATVPLAAAAKPASPRTLDTPTIVYPTLGTTVAPGTDVVVTWTKVAHANAYLVQVRVTDEYGTPLADDTFATVTGTSYDLGQRPGTSGWIYCWVTAENTATHGTWVDAVSADSAVTEIAW